MWLGFVRGAFVFEGDGLSFPQAEKMASEPLETRSDFSHLVLKAPGDCFFEGA